MVRKIILLLAALVVIAGWPVSLIINPPKMKTGLVWQLNDADEEKRLLFQKLGLDSSQIKRIFYNNKTTILFDRYTKNVLTMVNLNNYFFDNFPKTEATEADSRMKFPYPAIIGFLVGTYVSIKKKKHLKLWLAGGVIVLLVSLFKEMDGWNMTIYPILGIITIEGLKEINKNKLGWLLLSLITFVGFIEIGRLFL